MLSKKITTGTFAALLAATLGASWIGGCSVTSNSSGGDCVSRCTAIADKCGGNASKCSDSCETLTSSQLTCVEDADCDMEQSLACLTSEGSDDTATAAKKDSGTVSSGDDCVDRCNAIAKKCKSKTNHCERDCPKTTEKQISCLEEAGCDGLAQLACFATDTKDSGAPVDPGSYASYLYETSNTAIQGYAVISGKNVFKLSVYVQQDGTYVLYYREGLGSVTTGGFSGSFSAPGYKLTGSWAVSGDSLTIGDLLSCAKSGTKVTCTFEKDIQSDVTGIAVPMTSSNNNPPDSATEWKSYTL